MNTERVYKLESCVVSLEQAISAQERGADRVELCSRLETDGLTPDQELTSSLCDHLTIPVRVMIRTTPNGFWADGQVLNEMIRSINEFKHLPVEGFVMGLIKNNRIDRVAMKTLFEQAAPFSITFHKAIDSSDNIKEDIEWLNQQKIVDTILTSGQAKQAIDGMPLIQKMNTWFKGDIMACGKITPLVLQEIEKDLLLTWYHGRAIV